MGWFKNSFFSVEGKSVKVPQGLWVKCQHCAEIIYKKELERDLEVCPKCSYHFRLPAMERINMLFDKDTFEEFDPLIGPTDSLGFKDIKKYKDKIKAYQKKTGHKDALISGFGTINGQKVMTAVFDFAFMGGSMGAVVGEKITRVFERALEKKCGVITFAASGGARMQEGILSLMQMAKTSAAVGRLKEAGLPFISVLTDPTTGGVTASFAMLGDIIVAEPGALIGFAGPRVIAQTIKQTLPEGFQRAEYILEHGMIDMIVERKDMKESLGRLLEYLS
ncbi:MAG: acetyl-CoA carboxylase, carboxyltransferase subunit beta [Thermodesulfobacteriota bacterium]